MQEKIEWPKLGMTVDETAEALRVAPNTIRQLIHAGDFPARKVGKGWRIDHDAVKAWIATGGIVQEDEKRKVLATNYKDI